MILEPKKRRTNLGVVLIGVLITLVCGLFALEFVQIQIVQHDEYVEERYKQYTVERDIMAARGEILLRDGTPIVANKTVNNVIIDEAQLPNEGQNEVYIRLAELLSITGEDFVDTLPITKTAPFAFVEGREDDVVKLKTALGKQEYATVSDVLDKLYAEFKISEDYTDDEKRLLVGIRYEMQQQDFSIQYPFTFAEDVSREIVLKLREAKSYFPGVTTEEATIREYTNGHFAPHLWGTVGPIYKEEYEEYKELGYKRNEIIGKDGIEKAFETELRGQSGKLLVSLDNMREVIGSEVTENPTPGNTVYTTLDPALQLVAQQSLEKTIIGLQSGSDPAGKGKEANAGVAAVIQVQTGEVLALAQYPSFDLSEYRTKYNEILGREGQPLFPRGTKGLYAPGSSYKPLVSVAGLAEGVITPTSTVKCGGVYTFYPSYQPKCLGVHGNFTVKRALQRSCNIFFYDTGRILGIDRMNKYAKQFGMAQPTGLEIAEETGLLAGTPEAIARMETKTWVPGDVLQAAIGQSNNLFTPLQMANYVATIARNGERKEVHLISKITDYYRENAVMETQPVTVGHVDASPDVFKTVREGMVMASEPGGTSYSYIGAFPFQIASKTGTPQTALDKENSVYICFPNVDNPEIAIFVIIENGWHGYTAAPVARDILNAYYFDNYGEYNVDFEQTSLAKVEDEEESA